jgi:hypothetical protein
VLFRSAAFDRVLFEASPSGADLASLDRASGHAQGERFLLYRDLVRSRLKDLVATALPRTTALLGRAAMDREVDARLSSAPPTTRFFREVVEQLFDPREPRLSHPEHPELGDLARLELAQWRAIWLEVAEPAAVDFDFAKRPVLTATMTRLELAFSVHLADRPVSRGNFHIAVYRRRDHVVETRWMNEELAAILDAWHEGSEPAIEGVRTAMSRLGRAPTPELVESMSGMLAELLERGGVLGSRP